MTEAGLNTVNLSTLTTFQQVILWLLIVVGSAIFVSVATVRTRKRAFEVRFGEVVGRYKEERRRERMRSGSRDAMGSRRGDGNGLMRANWTFPSTSGGNGGEDALEMEEGLKVRPVGGEGDDNCMTAISEISPRGGIPKDMGDHITFAPNAYPVNGKGKANDVTVGSSNTETATPARSTNFQFPTSISENTIKHRVQETSTPIQQTQTGQQDLAPLQYPSYLNSNTTGRNAQFHGLSRAEREHLGGVEYRAISFLAWLVPLYFILWQLLGGIGLGAYMAYNKSNVALENGINPWWLGVFNAISAFNNSGMSLLDLNVVRTFLAPPIFPSSEYCKIWEQRLIEIDTFSNLGLHAPNNGSSHSRRQHSISSLPPSNSLHPSQTSRYIPKCSLTLSTPQADTSIHSPLSSSRLYQFVPLSSHVVASLHGHNSE